MKPVGTTRSIIRDAYGFEVPEKHVGLYSECSGKWSTEEKRRTHNWLQFLKDITPEDYTNRNILSTRHLDEKLELSLRQIIVSRNCEQESEFGDRLVTLVRNGIPQFLRGSVWSLFLNHDSKRVQGLFKILSSQTGAYKTDDEQGDEGLHRTQSSPDDVFVKKHLLRTFTSGGVMSPMRRLDDNFEDNNVFTIPDSRNNETIVKQIDKDVSRTFPGHPVLDESGLASLREILLAFSLHRPDIGYCQGLNFMSGFLLLFNKPEDAFWNLVAIIEKLLPDQFDKNMLPAVVDKFVFRHLVRQYYPKLAEHLDELTVDVSALCPQWFLCCFVNALPTESCLRVWDILLWEGNSSFLFKVALALVDSCFEDLMKAENAVKAWEVLQNMASSCFDSSSLIQTALDKFSEVEHKDIRKLQASYHKTVKGKNNRDVFDKETVFSLDENAEDNNTPRKIKAASDQLQCAVSMGSSSSSGSVLSSDGQHPSTEITTGSKTHSSMRFVREALRSLEQHQHVIPEEFGNLVSELIDRLKERESENRQLQLKLSQFSLEEKRSEETNEALKLRLNATEIELDKKTEVLDRMIVKSQILTEKVASQEEVILQLCSLSSINSF
eukprot:g5095.t1